MALIGIVCGGTVKHGVFGLSLRNTSSGFKCGYMDIIYLKDLRIETVIGLYEWEKRIRQTLILDLEMATDIRTAAASDAIADTLDYKAVSDRVISFVQESRFQLVETLAEQVATILLREFDVPWLRLRINKKGALRSVRDVGVLIERGQRPE